MTNESAAVLERATPPASIFDRAVCLSLSLHRLGTQRKMKVAELQPGVETNADMVRVSKKLLDAPELDAIKRHDSGIRRWLETKVSGPALFRSGVYMIACELVGEVDAELQTRLDDRANILVPSFLGVYDNAVTDARRSLGVHFRAEQYPTRDAVAATFSSEFRYFTLGSPQGLERIRADIFEREGQKAAAQWSEVLEESRNVLRAEFSELVTHMVERLEPGAEGKTKRFNASTIDNLDDFLSTFAARNIADDAALQAIVSQAREALKGVRPETIRNSRSARDMARERFTEVKAEMERTIVVGGRKYDLED